MNEVTETIVKTVMKQFPTFEWDVMTVEDVEYLSICHPDFHFEDDAKIMAHHHDVVEIANCIGKRIWGKNWEEYWKRNLCVTMPLNGCISATIRLGGRTFGGDLNDSSRTN